MCCTVACTAVASCLGGQLVPDTRAAGGAPGCHRRRACSPARRLRRRWQHTSPCSIGRAAARQRRGTGRASARRTATDVRAIGAPHEAHCARTTGARVVPLAQRPSAPAQRPSAGAEKLGHEGGRAAKARAAACSRETGGGRQLIYGLYMCQAPHRPCSGGDAGGAGGSQGRAARAPVPPPPDSECTRTHVLMPCLRDFIPAFIPACFPKTTMPPCG